MATSTYTYSSRDSLIEIADMYKTNVHTLVDLNAWLRDPIDGHTYMYPDKAEIIQEESNLNYTGVLSLVQPCLEGTITAIVEYKDSNLIEKYEVSEYNKYSGVGGLFSSIGETDPNSSSIRFYKFNYEHNNVEYTNGTNVKRVVFKFTPKAKKSYLVVPVLGNGNSTAEDYWNIVDDALGIKHDVLMSNILSKSVEKTNPSSKTVYNSANLSAYTAGLVDSELKKNVIDVYHAPESNTYDDDLEKTTVDFVKFELGAYIQDQINNAAVNFEKYISKSDHHGMTSDDKTIKFETYKKEDDKWDTNLAIEYNSIGNSAYAKCKIWIGNVLLNMPCFPEQVSDGVKANYNSDSAIGMSSPYVVYTSTGERSIPFRFDMHREMTNNENEIDEIVRYIESAVYPNYGNYVASIPVTVEIGNHIRIRGVMTDEKTVWSGPIDENGKYKQVTIDFTIQEVRNSSLSASNVASIGGWR